MFTLAKVSKQQHQSASTGESSNQSAKNTDSWPELGPAPTAPRSLPCPIPGCSPVPALPPSRTTSPADLAPRARFSIKGPRDGGKKGCLVLQTLAHRCGKTKIDLNLYRVKKITWEATGTFGEGRSLYRAPRSLLTEPPPPPPLPCRALGNDSSSWIHISLFSALIISSDYLKATVHHPFASQKLPHTIAPTCPRPQPASLPSTGLNSEAALENPIFFLLLGSFPSSGDYFASR